MRTTAYLLGALAELATRCRPRLGWRTWQRLRTWALHLRDLAACLAAIGMLWLLAALVGA